jgi:hypothetical protein
MLRSRKSPHLAGFDYSSPGAYLGKDDFDLWLASFTERPPQSCRGGPACPPSATRRHLGDVGEDLAAAAMQKQSYKILEWVGEG